MPYLHLSHSFTINSIDKEALLKTLSSLLANTLNKPEQYVMISFEESSIIMSGDTKPAAFVDIRSIGGLTEDINRRLSSVICELLEKKFQVKPERVYLNFTDITAQNWGWNRGTFA